LEQSLQDVRAIGQENDDFNSLDIVDSTALWR